MPHPAATPLRVLFVCANDFREASAKQALWFAEELTRRGHSVLMSVTGDPGTVGEELSGVEPSGGAGRPVVRAHRWRGPLLSRDDIAAVEGFRPDVIHVWNPRLAAVAAARRYLRSVRAPVVVHWEDDEWRIRADPMGRSLFRRLMRPLKRTVAHGYPPLGATMTEGTLRWIRSTAAGLDALTPALAEHVSRGVGLACAVIGPVTPPAPAGRPAPNVERGWLRERVGEGPVALWTGSVHPGLEADVRAAMTAVAEVQRRGHPLEFVHVGEVLPRYDTTAWANEAGLRPGTAHFLGYVPYPRVPELLREARILLSSGAPNDYNRLRLPSKVQAYLASGTPTITFGIGFGELLEDRREALLVHSGDPREIADRMVELLTDEPLRAELAAGGPAAARRLFDPEANTAALVGYYRTAIARHGSPSR